METDDNTLESHKLILDSLPIIASLWGQDDRMLYCNKAFANFLGVSGKDEVISRFFEFSTEYQPCGTPSPDKLKKIIAGALRDGSNPRCIWTHRIEGRIASVELTTARLQIGGNYAAAVYGVDLRPPGELEERNRLILDAVPMAISIYDKNMNIIDYNQESLAMFGLSDKLEYKELAATMAPLQENNRDSLEVLEEMFKKALREGYARTELLCRKVDGTLMPGEVVWVRVRYKDDYIIIEYVNDLTEVKSAIRKEREAHEMNEIFLNFSPFVMNIWDDNYNLISTSQQAVEMFGLSGADQYIHRFSDLSPKYQPCGTPSNKMSVSFLLKAFKEGRASFEWMHQTLSGEPLPTEVTLARFTRNGRHMLAAYTADLRPVKAAEEFGRRLLDNSPMFMEFWDTDNNLLDCNRKMLEVFGVDSREEFKERFYDFALANQPCGLTAEEKNMAMIQQAIKHGRSRSEWTFLLPGGEELPAETTWVHITHQGKPMIIVYSQDLRPIKQETERMLDEMRRRETAEDESKAKTRFLARMSHEIRTPMNAVLGIAGIQLNRSGHPPETAEAFSHIFTSATLLLNIINDILDLSKVEAGKMEITPAAYDMPSLIVDTVQLNIMYLGSKKIEFKLSVDPMLPVYLIGDELRIKQILNNLLSNAFKYTQEGRVSLSFSFEQSDKEGEIILAIVVSDTGYGMNAEQIGRLSDEFYRSDMRKNRSIEGTGLGMPIAYSLIKLMNGDISVESEPGKGSTFIVRLPQKFYGDEVLGKEAAQNLQNLELVRKALKKMAKVDQHAMPYGRVLVVDDVEANLYVVEGILDAYEIKVETAESGIKAVEKIQSGELYDIIFMDHMMPEMDGIQAVKIIRDMGYNRPIVALTANALKDAAEMFINNGFSGFISKPIDINQLDGYLTRFIRDVHFPPETGR